ASSVETSANPPRPARRTLRNVATAATAAVAPAAHSPTRPPVASGGVCRRPRLAIEPHHAWSVNSVAARAVQGPDPPNQEIATTPTDGARVRSSSTLNP